MYQFGGMPSIFYTINPADMDQPHMLKLSLWATHGDRLIFEGTFPPDLTARTLIYKENPAYCAKVFDQLVRAVLENLFQVIACGREVKNTKEIFEGGIFGRAFMNSGSSRLRGEVPYIFTGFCGQTSNQGC